MKTASERIDPQLAEVTTAKAAASFVNPQTALAMVETLRRDGHKALVHTAAASNLGQMLNRVCIADGIELVNIGPPETSICSFPRCRPDLSSYGITILNASS